MRLVQQAAVAALLLVPAAGEAFAQSAPEAAPKATAPAARVSLEVLAALPDLDRPTLSPNGRSVLAMVATAGRQALVVTPLFEGKPVAFHSDKFDINWWRWVNDDWLIVGVGDTQDFYGEQVYVTRLLALSADLKQAKPLDWQRSGLLADDVIWIARDGSPNILLSKQTGLMEEADWYPSVFSVDVSTGKTRLVQTGLEDVWTWTADSQGRVRSGFRKTDGRRTLLYRGPEGGRFVAHTVKDRDADFPMPIIFKADGSAIAIANVDGREAVYQMALPSLTLGDKIFSSDRYDVDGLYANQAEDDLAGVSITETRPGTVWLDPALKTMQAELDKTLGNGNARVIDWSRDRSRLLVKIARPNQAGGLYYWDTNSPKMQRIGWYRRDLGKRELSPVKTITYRSRDGLNLDAVLTLPRHRQAANLPLIVMPHGGPAARDSEGFDWWAQSLAELGYAVIQPNYRGSTGYGSALQKAGEGEWGLKMQDDLLDAIDWAASQKIADPKRVCLVGASYGGYAALRGAQRDSGRYRCAVSYAGVSDLAAMKRYDTRFLSDDSGRYWKKQVADFTAVSPRFGAASFSMPVLLAHGAKDKRVPVRQSRLMVDELRKAGKLFDYLEQPEGDHHFSRADDRLTFLKALKAFLDKHNPA